MQHLQAFYKDFIQNILCLYPGRIRFVEQARFYELDIPIAEIIPHKIIDFRKCDAKFKFLQILCHFFHQRITCR